MNGSKVNRQRGILAMTAILFCAMIIPAYGQEVDPTWFDPWAPPVPAVVRATATGKQTKASDEKRPAKIKTVSTTQPKAKSHEKVVIAQNRPS